MGQPSYPHGAALLPPGGLPSYPQGGSPPTPSGGLPSYPPGILLRRVSQPSIHFPNSVKADASNLGGSRCHSQTGSPFSITSGYSKNTTNAIL